MSLKRKPGPFNVIIEIKKCTYRVNSYKYLTSEYKSRLYFAVKQYCTQINRVPLRMKSKDSA